MLRVVCVRSSSGVRVGVPRCLRSSGELRVCDGMRIFFAFSVWGWISLCAGGGLCRFGWFGCGCSARVLVCGIRDGTWRIAQAIWPHTRDGISFYICDIHKQGCRAFHPKIDLDRWDTHLDSSSLTFFTLKLCKKIGLPPSVQGCPRTLLLKGSIQNIGCVVERNRDYPRIVVEVGDVGCFARNRISGRNSGEDRDSVAPEKYSILRAQERHGQRIARCMCICFLLCYESGHVRTYAIMAGRGWQRAHREGRRG